mgnify:CR=1 FL=1
MPKLGLALSGGGFRATLYHLGVIRYLRDTGKLEEVSDIASVSGCFTDQVLLEPNTAAQIHVEFLTFRESCRITHV